MDVLRGNIQFRCVNCFRDLLSIHSKQSDKLNCPACNSSFLIKDGTFFFINSRLDDVADNNEDLIFKLKKFFKKYPKLFYCLAYLFGGIPLNISAKKFVKSLPKDSMVVNIGSGERKLGERVINLDMYHFSGVSIVASATNLPFQNNSIDAVVCDYLLEHTEIPEAVIREAQRVLKLGGLIYMGTPFIIGYHLAPGDFFRWTKEGVRRLGANFEEVELKVAYGPTAALVSVLSNWLAILFSFNNSVLYGIWLIVFMVMLCPLQFVDLLLGHYKLAGNIALGFYFIGKKKI